MDISVETSVNSDLLGATIECLKKYNPQKIILFGSYARGDADEYSDFDFVLIKESDKRFLERLIDVAILVDVPYVKADVFVYTPGEWQEMVDTGSPFASEVMKEGKTVYEAG